MNPVTNALFAFESRTAGERAAEALTSRGLPAAAVQRHVDVSRLPGHHVRDIDEQITGGLVGNLVDMFRGVMEWGDSPHDGSPFVETIRRGGMVVAVDADSPQQQALAEQAMAACDRRTPWSDRAH